MNNLGNRSVQILVVDPDMRSGNQMREALTDEGYRCWTWTNANDAIELARQMTPSLMIIDTDLDDVDGFDLYRTIAHQHSQPIPVIFVSGQHGAEIIERSRAAGGIYFLGKPIDPSVLLELVDKALWMPHLIRRHIDATAHNPAVREPRLLADGVLRTRS